MNKKSLIAGTFVLTLASLITRLLGFVFRIYQSQVMGAEGVGLYQLLFPIYMLLWAASSAGISLAIANMIAKEVSKGEEGNAVHILNVSLLISLPLSFVLSIIVFFGAPWIAQYYIHEPVTELSLRILALCVPFMSTACCLRGYFQGHQDMTITALAQIVEQVARMAFIFILAPFLVPLGIKYICALGVIGMAMGEVFSFIMSYIAYVLRKRKTTLRPVSLKTKNTFNMLLALTIPITANRFLTSWLSSYQNILIPLKLRSFGLSSHESLALYGKFSGMAMPLFLFPSMVTASLATALVPAISDAIARNQKDVLQTTIGRAVQFSALIGIGSTALFLAFADEMTWFCYHMEDVGLLLKWLAFVCPFYYLYGVLTGIMNGLGMQKRTFQVNIISSILCIVTILVVVPRRGIIGFVLALLFQSGFACCSLLTFIFKIVDLKLNLLEWIIKPSLAAVISFFVGVTFNQYLFAVYCPSIVALILGIGTLGCVYLLCLMLFGSFSIKEIRTLIGAH